MTPARRLSSLGHTYLSGQTLTASSLADEALRAKAVIAEDAGGGLIPLRLAVDGFEPLIFTSTVGGARAIGRLGHTYLPRLALRPRAVTGGAHEAF